MKRIVITGGPSTGKTTLIDYMEQKGLHCIPEISRAVILAAREEGIEQLFLEDPILFSQRLLEGRLRQFKETAQSTSDRIFFDRGLPDVTAYMDYLGTTYPEHFPKTCLEYRYDVVFLLPPWKEIYQQDSERYESFEQAEKIHLALVKAYEKYNYNIHTVPFGTVEERMAYILTTLKINH
ncbi:AAA family ATPase [Cochleicola gelatinilyticus]|nr:ATP-binding protein [Cochleicola gelatinilyticus]